MNYGEQSIDEFLSGVASEEVTPAGGTAAAVAGATGAALCEMVCIHAIESPDDGDVSAELAPIRDDLQWYRTRLLALADADADAVAALLAALPSGDADPETKRATGVPLAVAEAGAAVLDHATVVTEAGNRTAAPDAVTGAILAHAAVRAAAFTVRSNVERIDDPSFVDEVRRRTAAVERAAERACTEVVTIGEARR